MSVARGSSGQTECFAIVFGSPIGNTPVEFEDPWIGGTTEDWVYSSSNRAQVTMLSRGLQPGYTVRREGNNCHPAERECSDPEMDRFRLQKETVALDRVASLLRLNRGWFKYGIPQASQTASLFMGDPRCWFPPFCRSRQVYRYCCCYRYMLLLKQCLNCKQPCSLRTHREWWCIWSRHGHPDSLLPLLLVVAAELIGLLPEGSHCYFPLLSIITIATL